MIRSQNKGGDRFAIADFMIPFRGHRTLSVGPWRLLFFSGRLESELLARSASGSSIFFHSSPHFNIQHSM